MFAADAELLTIARRYKAEFKERMFGIKAQTAALETEPAIEIPLNSNVVGVGFGLRATNNSSPQGEHVLRVYVREKLPHSSLSSTEIVPLAINGLPTDIISVGNIVPTQFSRPTKCGVSVGHYQVTAGTIGCLVRRTKATDDERYILSNNHVLANCNDAEIGDPILHPGPLDGGNSSNPIAVLTEFERLHAVVSGMKNVMDAAIAKVLNCDEVLPEVIGIGTLQRSEFASLQVKDLLGRRVCKYGRTTGYTEGTVRDISFDTTAHIIYNNNLKAAFEEQIVIGWSDQPFSGGGDSGSLVVDCTTRQPIALLFAGGETAGSFATPINEILTRFEIEIL